MCEQIFKKNLSVIVSPAPADGLASLGAKISAWTMTTRSRPVYTLRPRQDGRHFADDIFQRIFFNENVWISNKISLKCVLLGPINNIPALHGSDNGLSPGRRQTIIWTYDDVVYWRIYASLGLNVNTLLASILTHQGRISICVSRLSHYLDLRWIVVDWNLTQNEQIFNQENTFENVVCQMAVILFRHQCIKTLAHSSVQSVYIHSNANSYGRHFNTLRPRQNGRRFIDDISNFIFSNEFHILFQNSLKFSSKDPYSQ